MRQATTESGTWSSRKVIVRIDGALKKKCPRAALGCVTALVAAGASPAALLEEMKTREAEIQKLPFPRGVLASPQVESTRAAPTIIVRCLTMWNDRESLAMGYNRSGERRKQRLRRQKREVTRIVAKMEAAAGPKTAASAKKGTPAKES